MFSNFLQFYTSFIDLYFSTELAVDIIICLLIVWAIKLLWSFLGGVR